MATSSIFNAIVPEALTKDNYPNWRSCVENYLLGQDLWDIIEAESKPTEDEATFNSWRKRNAMALHAIQISCGPDMLSRIRKTKSAKDAWDSLAKMHQPKSQKVSEPTRPLGDPETETNVDYARDSPLLNAVATGDWNATKDFLDCNQNEYPLEAIVSSDGHTLLHFAVVKGHEKIVKELVQLISEEGLKIRDNRGRTSLHYAAAYGFAEMVACMVKKDEKDRELLSIADEKDMTVLHHAVIKGHVKIVEELVQLMSKEDLEKRDNRGRTALHYAAAYGFDEMVACMVEKEAELVSIADEKGVIPVVSACQSSKKDMTRYLYSLTPLKDLTSQDETNRATLLCYCITNNMFDVALEVLQKCPRLAFASDAKGETLISVLSRMPSAFYSELSISERSITSIIYFYIYSCICVPSTPPSNDTRINIPRQYQLQTNQGSIVTQVLGQLRGSLSNLLKLPGIKQIETGIKQIYDTKLIHTQASQLLDVICDREKGIPTLSPTGPEMDLVRDALFCAVEHGIVQFVKEITKAAPYLLSILDTDKRSIFHCAIVSRQEKILSLAYGVDSHKKDTLTTLEDEFGNNMLHLAGKLAPSTRLHRIPGAALQMQRELQWFKEVERIVPPMCKEMLNSNRQTPRQLFTKEHSELAKEGEKWMKEAASSCAFVGALIVTFTFTAALTPPGGNNQNNGVPIFWDKKLFRTFTTCSVCSFITGITSILIFLEILTSRHAEKDFLISLPTKMILGLATLTISIVYMTVAFSSSYSLANGQMQNSVTSVVLLASIPIITAIFLQYSLYARIFAFTCTRSILNRKTKCWYK